LCHLGSACCNDLMTLAGLQISQHEKVNKSRPRYVVFTQGPDPTIIAVEGKVCFPRTLPLRPLQRTHYRKRYTDLPAANVNGRQR